MLRLGKLILAVGCLWSAGSVAHWYSFYDQVLRAIGDRGPPPPECLFTLKGACGTVANAARLFGYAPYDPHHLWAGLVIACVGIALMILATHESAKPGIRENQPPQA